MATLEQVETYRDGKLITLWRCVDCTRSLARATGKPLQDNGFVEWPNPVSHVASCTLAKRTRNTRKQGELF
jgi:hypothetical protein